MVMAGLIFFPTKVNSMPSKSGARGTCCLLPPSYATGIENTPRVLVFFHTYCKRENSSITFLQEGSASVQDVPYLDVVMGS